MFRLHDAVQILLLYFVMLYQNVLNGMKQLMYWNACIKCSVIVSVHL